MGTRKWIALGKINPNCLVFICVRITESQNLHEGMRNMAYASRMLLKRDVEVTQCHTSSFKLSEERYLAFCGHPNPSCRSSSSSIHSTIYYSIFIQYILLIKNRIHLLQPNNNAVKPDPRTAEATEAGKTRLNALYTTIRMRDSPKSEIGTRQGLVFNGRSSTNPMGASAAAAAGNLVSAAKAN